MRIEWINAAAPVVVDGGNSGLSRRNFMKITGVLGGGLVLGFVVPGANKFAHAHIMQRLRQILILRE